MIIFKLFPITFWAFLNSFSLFDSFQIKFFDFLYKTWTRKNEKKNIVASQTTRSCVKKFQMRILKFCMSFWTPKNSLPNIAKAPSIQCNIFVNSAYWHYNNASGFHFNNNSASYTSNNTYNYLYIHIHICI